ncbi:hypothetical protein ABZ791_35980 [Streptomyces huasconensis]|uniref:Uncharacterized protein n=1 Tax=Streptomyces huasconensis TaxID=1854574 RepID=A0ABV3M4T1_9ACTN
METTSPKVPQLAPEQILTALAQFHADGPVAQLIGEFGARSSPTSAATSAPGTGRPRGLSRAGGPRTVRGYGPARRTVR